MIDEKLIILDSTLTDKDSIIFYLSNKAKKLGYLDDRSLYIEAVIKREEEFSTAIGYDVCIPHGKSSEVVKPFICFLRTTQPIQWDENGNVVELVFLLGVPDKSETTFHLKVLSEISKKLLSADFRKELLAGDKNDVLDALYEVEKKIKNN